MSLRKRRNLLVFYLWSVSSSFIVLHLFYETTARKCGQQSQVIVSPPNASIGDNVTLTCSTNCSLTDNHTYIWYKNGNLTKITSQNVSAKVSLGQSFSCAVKGNEDLLSTTMCVRGHSCFNVSYKDQSICALKGLTVVLPCTYQYLRKHNLTEANWYIQEKQNEAPKNLSLISGYANRVEFNMTEDRDCTLRITDLRQNDSAEYKFRFKTNKAEWGYSFPGITLTVTELLVKVFPEEGKLSCNTTCTLTNNPNPKFIWYKNGQRLADPKIQDNYLFLEAVDITDASSYSCAVEVDGNEDGSPLMKAAIRIIVVVLILLVCVCCFLWFRKKACKSISETREKSRNGQKDSSPMSDNVSSVVVIPTAPRTADSDDQDDVHYASINLSHSKTKDVPLYSTVRLCKPQIQEEVQYAVVKYNRPNAGIK